MKRKLTADEAEFPVATGGRIPWRVAELAYIEYAKRYGRDQSLERLAERGGFHVNELDALLPEWRRLVLVSQEYADTLRTVADHLEFMIRYRHREAHNGDIYRGGDFEACPLCAEVRTAIVAARKTLAEIAKGD